MLLAQLAVTLLVADHLRVGNEHLELFVTSAASLKLVDHDASSFTTPSVKGFGARGDHDPHKEIVAKMRAGVYAPSSSHDESLLRAEYFPDLIGARRGNRGAFRLQPEPQQRLGVARAHIEPEILE